MEIVNKLKTLRHKVFIAYFRHLPIQKKKVVMWADSQRHFGCSPKYIALCLLKKYPGRFDIVWVLDETVEVPVEIPNGIRIVKNFSMEYLKEIHTAKFVICNMRTYDGLYWHKRSDQVYIQTWHSSLRLKKIERDAISSLGENYKNAAKRDSEKIDLLLSGCKFSTDIFKRAFWYDGEIMESGTPRCDILLSNTDEARDKVFRHYGIKMGSKLALYAPTFRSNKPSDFLGMDFESLKATLGADWKIGARLHPNIQNSVETNGAIAMSKYPDMQELLASADFLITDYSSCMFDMAIAKKPCILYVPDLEEYLSKERSLYFAIEDLPFPIAKSMNDLCDVIKHFDLEAYQKQLDIFMSKIGSYEDGHAAERVCERIIQEQQ